MLSTPLICCSRGAATACSSVWASAPTYVANTWISGGAILGNWAMGRLSTVMPPTITMRIAITMATMGRLMKNLDIWFAFPSFLRLWSKRLGIDLHAGAQFLQALSDDAFAGLQPLLNNPLRADAFADLDGLNAHFVVAVHDPYLERALKLRDGPLRDEQGALMHPARGAHFAIPAGAQNISRVGKKTGDPD